MTLKQSLLVAALGACVTHANQYTANSKALSRWTPDGKPAPESTLQLHVALRHSPGERQSMLDSAMTIASPDSPSYRQHLSADDMQTLIQPEGQAIDAVQSWLLSAGISSSLVGDMVIADAAPISTIESLLNATYSFYTDSSSRVVRTDRYTLPESIAERVDFITPTVHFPRLQSHQQPRQQLELLPPSSTSEVQTALQPRSGDPCALFVTPECIRSVYNISYTPAPNRTTFAVYGTEAASLRPDDLQTFLKYYNAPASAAHAQFRQVGSGNPADGSSGVGPIFETALDTQTSLGTAWPASGVFYNQGGVFGPDATRGHTYDRFVAFLTELTTSTSVPSVVSFSEGMPEDMMDPAYADRLCDMMAKVGMRGVSLLFSSGDNGPSGDQPTGNHTTVFEPEFPASCPWVTAVGGTTKPRAETAATKSTMQGLGYTSSGGGFSARFGRPAYQKKDVDQYVQQQVPASYYTEPGFNGSGRGYPDVAALSTNFPTVVYGLTFPVGGTSASTPLWAAVVTLLNDYEASRGRPSLGFLNPWLYGPGRAGLKDITTGGNNEGSCIRLSGCTLPKTLGFEVSTGWDAVTGLGSPNVGKLIEALG